MSLFIVFQEKYNIIKKRHIKKGVYMNILIILGSVVGFYLVLFFITRINRNKDRQLKSNVDVVKSPRRREIEHQDIKGKSVFGGDKYVLDFANEKYNKDDQPTKRGDPLTFTSYTPAPLPKDEKKGSLLITFLFLDNPLIWALFPSIRRSIRDYLNRD